MARYENILERIGNTPLVKLGKLGRAMVCAQKGYPLRASRAAGDYAEHGEYHSISHYSR